MFVTTICPSLCKWRVYYAQCTVILRNSAEYIKTYPDSSSDRACEVASTKYTCENWPKHESRTPRYFHLECAPSNEASGGVGWPSSSPLLTRRDDGRLGEQAKSPATSPATPANLATRLSFKQGPVSPGVKPFGGGITSVKTAI